jgi:DNA (cytosine-5)-methyltransferase 1
MERLRIGSFFSGIGAFEKALERLEIPHETVFYCEIDKYASKAYSLIHNVPESFNLWDITKVDETELPEFDLMTWGFPCQDISVAGKQAGIVEGETRSGLYYDGLRILKHKMPKYSIIENVKNLTSEKFRPIFHQILCDLEDAGYHSYYEVLNAKDYGIPQNRERIFIVSIRKDVDQGFVFPLPFDNGLRLKDLLEDEVDEKYYISQEKTEKLLESMRNGKQYHSQDYCYAIDANYYKGVSQSDLTNGKRQTVTVSVSRKGEKFEKEIDIAHTLMARDYKGFDNTPSNAVCVPVLTPDRQEKQQNGRRFKDDGEPMFSLTTQDMHGVLQYIGGIGDNKWLDDGNELSRNYPQGQRVYGIDGLAVCQNANGGGLGAKTGLYLIDTQGRKNKKPKPLDDCPTLRSETHGNLPMIVGNYRIRKLTPLECFRLMGFDDDDFYKLKYCTRAESEELLRRYPKHKGKRIFSHKERVERISDSQLYKMAGNSIVVQVLEGILGNLLKSGAEVPDCFYGEQMNLFG